MDLLDAPGLMCQLELDLVEFVHVGFFIFTKENTPSANGVRMVLCLAPVVCWRLRVMPWPVACTGVDSVVYRHKPCAVFIHLFYFVGHVLATRGGVFFPSPVRVC